MCLLIKQNHWYIEGRRSKYFSHLGLFRIVISIINSRPNFVAANGINYIIVK